MPELSPFRGMRFADSDRLKELVCPPYDVISPAEQKRLHERNPTNAVHLELSQAHEDREARNREVAEVWRRWIDEGIIVQEASESFYVYRQDFVSQDGRRCRV
ncbi:MAG TPA: DUF1015 family protein, partial [Actinomycetota bacterium]|nr:DUF1015 family protein [Actinomycetota bacterium]